MLGCAEELFTKRTCHWHCNPHDLLCSYVVYCLDDEHGPMRGIPTRAGRRAGLTAGMRGTLNTHGCVLGQRCAHHLRSRLGCAHVRPHSSHCLHTVSNQCLFGLYCICRLQHSRRLQRTKPSWILIATRLIHGMKQSPLPRAGQLWSHQLESFSSHLEQRAVQGALSSR